MNQSELVILVTGAKRGKTCEQGKVGFGFASHRLREIGANFDNKS